VPYVRIVHGVFGLARVVRGLLLGVALSVVFGGCSKKAAPRLRVVVTIFPIYDLARTVAGPDADVVLLLPPGLSVHDRNAAPSRVDALLGARLGIMVGLGLDEWMQPLLDRAAPSAHRLAVGDRVPTIPIRQNPVGAPPVGEGSGETEPNLEGKPDPHVWLDPERAMLISEAIAEEMVRVDPTHAAGYRSRSFALQQDLDALDREVEGRTTTWASRSFVSFHPAFAYYAERYHLEIAACLEPVPGVAPPPQYEEKVVGILRAKRIAGVFREPQLPSDPAAIVARAAGIPIGILDPIGGQSETDTYDKLIRFDTDALDKIMKSPPPPIEHANPPPPFPPSGDGSASF
jgi:zinc transport system substrate-binding protein